MKRVFVCISALYSIVCSSGLQAQLLWQAVSENNKDTIYLFGTMHLEMGNFFTENAKLTRLMDESATVVLETEMDLETVSQEIIHYIQLPDSVRISDKLTPLEYSILDSLLQSAGMLNAAICNGFKPNFVSTILATMQFQKDSLFTPELALDKTIQKRAIALNKTLLYFETDAEQMEILFNKQSIEMQFEMLKSAIKYMSGREKDEATEMTNRLPQLYRSQQLDSIQNLVVMSTSRSAEDVHFYKTLLLDRNMKWISKLDTWLPENRKMFMAVGAAHLPGNDGLLQLLRNKKFTVTPVQF